MGSTRFCRFRTRFLFAGMWINSDITIWNGTTTQSTLMNQDERDNHTESPVGSTSPPGYLVLRPSPDCPDQFPSRPVLSFRRELVLQRACPGKYRGNTMETSQYQVRISKQNYELGSRKRRDLWSRGASYQIWIMYYHYVSRHKKLNVSNLFMRVDSDSTSSLGILKRLWEILR